MKARANLSQFMPLIGLGSLCVPFVPQLSAANDPNKPNFLYIQTDQYRYDLIKSVQDDMPRYDGKTKIRTPNLDRLRNEGVYFRNAYTQCAVCGPARSTFRTGNTLERHGQQSNDLYRETIYNRNAQFKNKIEANVTFDQILVSKRGYVAEHFGKWHIPRIYNLTTNRVTQMMRYNDVRFTGMTNDTDYAHIVYSFVNSDASFDYDNRLAEVAGGLSKVEEPGMQQDTYSKYPYVTDAIDVRYGLAPYTANNPLTGIAVGQPDQQGRSTLPANRTSSRFEGVAAIGALDRMARGSEPFVLTASFHNPHAPMIATGLYYDYYKALEDNMLLPDSLSGADMVNSGWLKSSDPDYQNAAKVKEWMVSYYALCEEVDHYVGLLLDKLDEYNIATNTLVIFVSDHGEALGSHGTREKNTFLEESAHVPLLMRFPGRIAAGTVVDEPVATLDCVATTLDYVGAGAYDVSDGRSLRRYIEKANYNETFDDEAIVTEWDFRTPTTNSVGDLDRDLGGEVNFMCRKGPWKLMITKKADSTKKDMLYNLDTDPYEMVNYIGDNGMTASDEAVGKAEHLKCLLVEWMQRMDGGTNQYFSNPVWNEGVGMGDIAEVSARRKWKLMNIWVSDTAVEVGLPVDVAGQLTRNEYIYLGRTTAGTLTVTNITVQGADAGRIQLSGFTSGSITQGNHGKVKLTYRPTYYGQPISDAQIVISHSAGADKVIELSAAAPPNSRPVITSIPATTVDIGNVYSYTLTATDVETNALSYSSVTLPAWLSFNTNTAVLSGTPSTNYLGANSVVLRVSDLYGSTDQSFTVWVGTAGNDVPVITTLPGTGVIENQLYSYTISAVDADGDTLTYSAPVKPSWLSFNPTNRILSGTPAPANVGLHPVSLTVSDGLVTVTQQFNVAVFATPSLDNLIQNGSFESGSTGWYLNEMSVTNAQASDGTYSLYVYGTGSDTRGNPRPSPDPALQTNTDYVLTYDLNYVSGTGNCVARLTNLNKLKSTTSSPTSGWVQKTLSFNSGTNATLLMELYVDGPPPTNFVAYWDNFVVTEVGAVGNTAPVITSIPVTTATQDAAYSYTLLAADAEDDPLTFSLVTSNSWLSFNAETGVLSGTPSSGDAGSHAVTLRVSDGSLTNQQSFSITVALTGSGYEAWAATQPEVIGTPNFDYDGDGRNNLYEYALDGDPTDDQDNGVDPTFVNTGDGFEYAHLKRHGDSSLIYAVETRTNLVSGVWTSTGYSVLGTNSYNADYDAVTYSISTTNANAYIRLKITKP